MPFRRLREGKLFVVETDYPAAPDQHEGMSVRRAKPPRRVEHYWLCDECSNFITLTFDRERGMITVPLPEVRSKPPLSRLPLHQPLPSPEKPETRTAAVASGQARGVA
jgi:hypothetical protein